MKSLSLKIFSFIQHFFLLLVIFYWYPYSITNTWNSYVNAIPLTISSRISKNYFYNQISNFHSLSNIYSYRMKLYCSDNYPMYELDSNQDISINLYSGPKKSMEDMLSGVTIDNLGIRVLIGPSTLVNGGLGLYLSVADDVDETILSRGEIICGYSKGSFVQDAIGSKSVAFAFSSLDTGVIFNKKLQSLEEAMNEACLLSDSDKLTNIIEGHLLLLDESDGCIKIYLDPEYEGGRYFIPEDDNAIGPGYYGMYANDLAYEGNDMRLKMNMILINHPRIYYDYVGD